MIFLNKLIVHKDKTTLGRSVDGSSFQVGASSVAVKLWMPLPEPPKQ